MPIANTPATSGQTTAQYLSKVYDLRSSASYRLVLAIAGEAIQFAVLNDIHEVMLLREYQNPTGMPVYELFDKVCFEDEALKQRYSSVEIYTLTRRWMLVPSEYAPNGSESKYLATEHTVSDTDDAFYRDLLRPLGINNVYALTQFYVKRLQFYFKRYVLKHGVTPYLLEANRLHAALGKEASLCIAQVADRSILLAFGPSGLLLANDYETETAEDVLYYATSTLQTLGLTPNKTAVFLLGRAAHQPATRSLLQTHLPGYTDVTAHFSQQAAFASAGYSHGEFAHLLFRQA